MPATSKATETPKALSKGQKVANDVASLIRSRNSLLWVVTREEARVEGFLAEEHASFLRNLELTSV